MTEFGANSKIKTAFVTGATGLLGNNLVRLLVLQGVRVKALARSREKAEKQLAGLPVEIVVGDMTKVSEFAEQLAGTDVLFHTAAFFRDNFKGGRHQKELRDTNVQGTADLLNHAYAAGVRRVVHTSSIAVLRSERGQLTNETMLRNVTDAEDDYYLSKVLSDREVEKFLEAHPDMWACMVLPGWMTGPGDIGPTSSGQVILDFLNRKMPGIPPATFSIVDARDVAQAMWLAGQKGRRGERYLAAGRHIEMGQLFEKLQSITGIAAPRRKVPIVVLFAMAAASEVWAAISGKPVLISMANVRLMAGERDRSHFDNSKSERELGVRFRPVEETLRDTVTWYQENGWIGESNIRKSRVGWMKAVLCNR